MHCRIAKIMVVAMGLVTALDGAASATAPSNAGAAGLCRAWSAHHRDETRGRGASDDATAFAALAQRAGGPGKVSAYCEAKPDPQDPATRYQARVLADGAAVYWSLDRGTNSGDEFTGVGPAAVGLAQSAGWAEGPELLASPVLANASSLKPGPQGGSASCCSFTGPFSVSTWIEVPVGQSPPSLASFVDVGNGTWTGFHLTYNNGDVQFATSCGVGCESELRAPFAITPGAPTMIAASFDGAIGRIFANGQLLGSAPMQTPAPAAGPYLVGAYRSLLGPYYPWTGYQDAVALFPVALSDAQIAQHFSIGIGATAS